MNTRLVAFGSFRLDIERGELYEGNARVPLGWRATVILTALIEHADSPVSRDHLIRRAWPNTVVEESNLRVQISAIRKALRDPSGDAGFIRNIAGHGYLFSAEGRSESPGIEDNRRRLPTLLAPVVGRETEIAFVEHAVRNRRLVTLTGIAGVGKTTLAIAVAHALTGHFPGGIHFLALSRTQGIDALRDTLGSLAEPSGAPAKGAAKRRTEKRQLLVVDGCEADLDDVGAGIDALLSSFPQVHCLATSRIPFARPDALCYRVDPLACPPVNAFPFNLDDALSFPAVQLFVDRARAATPGFDLQTLDGNALAEVCTHLDGLPLALESAALKTEGMDLRALSIQLRKSTAILSRSDAAAGEPRSSAIADAIASSVALLTEQERRVLLQLSVFRTHFSAEAARSVISVADLDADDLHAVLTALTAKSVILVAPDAAPTLFKIPRAYRDHLYGSFEQDPDVDTVLMRHAHHVHRYMQQSMPGRALVPRERVATLYGIAEEVRAALDWSFSPRGTPETGLELLVSAAYLWCHVSQFSEYVEAGQKALAATLPQQATLAEPRMRLSIALGISMYSVQGATPAMHELLMSGLKIATDREDLFWKALALRGLWKYFHGSSEQTAALSSADASLKVARAAHFGPAHATLKGTTYLYAGSLKRARRYLDYAIRISDPERTRHHTTDQSDQRVFDLCMHARSLWQTGHFAAAIAVAEGSLSDVMAKGRPIAIIAALALAVCPIYCWSDQIESAEQRLRLLEQYAALYEMDHWSRYGEVFRLGQSFEKEDVPNLRAKTSVVKHPWSQRHVEEFSVLRGGFVTPALVARARSSQPIWCSAENLRIYASKRTRQPGEDATRYTMQLLHQSLDIARRQSAVGWELRTSITLARILETQDRRREACDLITVVLDKIPGNPLTADHKEAVSFVEGQPLRDRMTM